MTSAFSKSLLSFIKERAAQPGASDDVLTQCDIAYSRWFLGLDPFEDDRAFVEFTKLLARHDLSGTVGRGLPRVNVHTTAYALGALNLASERYGEAAGHALKGMDWQWDLLLNPVTLIPRWPWKFTHHAWRVSHWIGGSASIVASLWRLAPEIAEQISLPQTYAVLEACDALINPKTGLFKTYKSELLQFAFRNLYRIRHDPDAGEVGGIVHLHWINYAMGRMPYRSARPLWDKSWKLMQKEPFMESVPYCLDFDVVQIVRTADPLSARSAQVRKRADRFETDVHDFLASKLNDQYTLHKLPGALATMHECALISERSSVVGIDIAPRDVMMAAYWI